MPPMLYALLIPQGKITKVVTPKMPSIAKFFLADYNFIKRHKYWEVYRSEKYMVTPLV